MKEPRRLTAEEVVARWDEFKSILDARSPSEYALDHLPGARNTPVLNDAERARVGTTNAQDGAFEAKRQGAALVARNIAQLIDTEFCEQPRAWSPLVYCWRGGQRSGSLATVLARVGWSVSLIEGGYKAFRQAMLKDLQARCAALRFEVIAGRTGTAKTRLLESLARHGAQILDLEALARHRGSVLGQWPAQASTSSAEPRPAAEPRPERATYSATHATGEAQPSAPTQPVIEQPGQKQFESLLWAEVRHLDPRRPVYVESESRKIGQCQIPEAMILNIRTSSVIQIEAEVATRTRFLVEDYRHLCRPDSPLVTQLQRLTALHGHERVAAWTAQAEAQQWEALVESLLVVHYDPAYDRSIRRNFPRLEQAQRITLAEISSERLDQAARTILERAESGV